MDTCPHCGGEIGFDIYPIKPKRNIFGRRVKTIVAWSVSAARYQKDIGVKKITRSEMATVWNHMSRYANAGAHGSEKATSRTFAL